ncbi:MAG TPA: hypothetical protein VHF25_03015 [Nitriliruptorales bacterium]|nr:hypothetical protein [Nitriliruptorales bacterium]
MTEDPQVLDSLQDTTDTRRAAVNQFMDPVAPTANVVGLADGIKYRGGEPTGEQALLVFVTQKFDEGDLAPDDRIPTNFQDVQTDVVTVGPLTAEQSGVGPSAGLTAMHDALVMTAEPQLLRTRLRPAPAGISIGHVAITAGTFGTVVYDFLSGSSTTPPSIGVGIPPRYYILSNNHVLANTNQARAGDAIVQPGPADGGAAPADVIARLTRFVPIRLDPPLPRNQHNNLVDAAIAEVDFQNADRRTYFSAAPRGWRPRANLNVGLLVKKTGRTTNFTTGRVIAVNGTFDIDYGVGIGRFVNQLALSNMSAPGDSGSLITTLDDVAVGLLYAGGPTVTIANHIQDVRAQLRIEIGEQML